MAIALSPVDGLRNTSSFPTNPSTEAAARDQIQSVIDQVVTQANTQLANKTQPAWINGTLQNGWTGTLQYFKDNMGFVHITGYLGSGTVVNGTTIAQIPVGYLPKAGLGITVNATNASPYGTMSILILYGTGNIQYWNNGTAIAGNKADAGICFEITYKAEG